ncbi:MAG TPA: polymer-forming cytoskeletal protein [Acidobacteriaceae bacterium]|nr:polymer-forming cytoskeletal protein [Acidobacteriaceae bacterium]
MSDQRVNPSTPDPARRPANVPQSTAPAVSTPSIIGKTISIKGEISGAESILIEGHVEGSISFPNDRVTVGPSGRVSATITAQDIVLQGEVTGSCFASDHVFVRRDGSLCGDVVTSRISIEEGAHLNGSIDIRKESKAAPGKVQHQPEQQAEQQLEPELVESAA